MKILVTGGAGFIGAILSDRLIELGHQVNIIDNFSNSEPDNVPKEAHLYITDITKGCQIMYDALDGVELVIHCAAIADVEACLTECIYNNVLGGVMLLDAMLETGIKRIINFSSAAVYGNGYISTIHEAQQYYNPQNGYGLSKRMFEKVLKLYARQYDLEFTSLRCFNVAGASKTRGEKRKGRQHLIPAIFDAILNGKILPLYGDGTYIRDFVHVLDVVEAVVALIEKEGCYDEVNIGTGKGCTIKHVVKECEYTSGHTVTTDIQKPRREDPDCLIADIYRAKKSLRFEPKYSLEDMIFHQWYFMTRVVRS